MTSLLHTALTESNTILHVSCAGAGLQFLQELWATPGSSAYFAGGIMPYDKTQLRNYLGYLPDGSIVSREVALEMAMTSYIRASEVIFQGYKEGDGPERQPVGIGITAAVASNRMPRGEQRVHAAIITPNSILSYHIPLTKGVGPELRQAHDEGIAEQLIGLLYGALLKSVPTSDALDRLMADSARTLFFKHPVFKRDGTRASTKTSGSLYLPGSLNPIHEGHRMMAKAAEEHLDHAMRATYLVAADSVHKPSLSLQELLFRAGMLRAERWQSGMRAVEFTQGDPLFLDKARERPESTFIVGVDTMARLLDPKWGPQVIDMLNEMRNLKIKFLVMGREVDGKWMTCRDVQVPFVGKALFQPLEGRLDISSSEIREEARA